MQKNHQYIAVGVIIVLLIVTGAIWTLAVPKASATAQTSQQNAGSAEKTTVRLGYLPSNGDGLFFIAKERGYFDEQGLDVQLSRFTNGADGYNALLANKIDIMGAGTSDPLTFIAKGAPISIIGGMMSEGQMVVAKPENAGPLANLSGWRGKTIAGVVMSNGDLVFRGALHDAGVDWKADVNFLELNSPSEVIEAVKTGKADGGIVFIPYEQIAKSQGLVVPIYSADVFPRHPCCRVSTLTQYLNNNRDTAVKFEKAMIKAYKYWNDDHAGTADAIKKYVKLNESVILNSTYNDYFYASPDPNTKGVDKFWHMMNDAGYVNSTVDIDKHIDASVYKQALDQVIAENPNDAFYQGLATDYQSMDS